MDEALSKCRSWTPPQASSFTHTECGVINTDNGSHWKQHMAIMQTVDVLVGAHRALALCTQAAGGRRGWPLSFWGCLWPRGELLEHCRPLAAGWPQRADARSLLSCGSCWNQRGAPGSCLSSGQPQPSTCALTGRPMQAPQGLAW